MPIWLSESEFATLQSVCDRMVPKSDATPGAVQSGAPEYIDTLLGAFSFDPPRIWAGGPSSGRAGGVAAFKNFHSLTAMDELAWRTRIEGSQGIPEREFNGPVMGLQQAYRDGLAALGSDFDALTPEEQSERLHATPDFAEMVFTHVCEGMYGAPEYGGNRETRAWTAIGFAGDVQPRGWTDQEVSAP